MTTELATTINALPVRLEQTHGAMLDVIRESMPLVEKDTQQFRKRQSQTMTNALTIAHPSPFRNLRQICSEIESAKGGIRESTVNIRKHEIEIAIKERDAAIKRSAETSDECLEADLLEAEADELRGGIMQIEENLSGAIRRVTGLIEQYDSIKEFLGVDEITEEDFEKHEEEHHIMTACAQALDAARASPMNLIDQGDHIYLRQLGINGGAVQHEINRLLAAEKEVMSEGKLPSMEVVHVFLNGMKERYKGAISKECERRGMTGTWSHTALLTKKDDETSCSEPS